MTATAADGVPASPSAQRRVQWAALVLQIEALILLLSPALELLFQKDLDDPRTALTCLVFAPIIWRVGHGVAHASRGAVLIATALYSFRVMATLGAPGGINAFDVVMMALEGTAIGLALHTVLTQKPAVDPHWRKELRLATAVPIALAFVWWLIIVPRYATRFQEQHRGSMHTPLAVLAMFMIGTAIYLTWRTALFQRVYAAFRPGAAPLDLATPMRSVATRTFARATRAPVLDFILAGVFGGLSLWVLVWVAGVASQSGSMLMFAFLLIPLGAVVGICVAVLWLASGLAVSFNAAWAKAVRTAAIVTSILFAFVLAPLVVGLVKIAVAEWLRRL